jgi:hypothetical protein
VCDTRRKKRSGQILIFGAIIIMLLVLSTAIIIQSSSTTYQTLRYSEVKELIQNFDEDFQRALRNTLVLMTQEYNATAEIQTPRQDAYGNFTQWEKAVIRTFASYGVQINFTWNQERLQPAKNFSGISLEERYAKDLTKLYWYSPQSISSILASYTIDIPSLGFYGWNGTTLLFLNMTVYTDSIANDQNLGTGFNVTVNREGGVPVDNLVASNFRIDYFDNSTQINSWQAGNITLLLNNGGGNYTIYIKTVGGKPVPPPLNKYLILWVQDSRGIVVESYTYTYIEYTIDLGTLNQNMLSAMGNPPKPNETYTFEMIHNGTLLWFGRPLAIQGTYIPTPIPPVKQFRVNVTVNGASDSYMPLSLSQVEVWTKDYAAPTLSFSDWKRRFDVGDKLVFFLTYAPAGVVRQRVRVTWLTDADASPPDYLLQFQNITNMWIVNNSVYNIGFHAGQTALSDPVGVDWNIQVNSSDNAANKYHVEYRLFNYDYSGGSLNYKIPWGPGDNQGWNFLQGPVRAVAYRSNDMVLYAIPPPGTTHTGELNHTEIVLIPYNVSYFELHFKANTEQQLTIGQNVVYTTLFSGTASDSGNTNRLSNASIDLRNSTLSYQGTVNGQFQDSSSVYNIYAGSSYNPTTAKQYGYWTAIYSSIRGQATFYDNATISSLKNFGGVSNPAMFVWTTGNGYKRDIRLDWAYYDSSRQITIPNNTKFFYNFAGWYYAPGGILTGTRTYNAPSWLNGYSYSGSTGDDNPSLYYAMFVGGGYDPFISTIAP